MKMETFTQSQKTFTKKRVQRERRVLAIPCYSKQSPCVTPRLLTQSLSLTRSQVRMTEGEGTLLSPTPGAPAAPLDSCPPPPPSFPVAEYHRAGQGSGIGVKSSVCLTPITLLQIFHSYRQNKNKNQKKYPPKKLNFFQRGQKNPMKMSQSVLQILTQETHIKHSRWDVTLLSCSGSVVRSQESNGFFAINEQK